MFSSASYNFVAGDVGAWIYIKSGTNWTPGWYKIASVASNQATLNATAGQAVLAAGTPTTANGCATTASPTSATWGIDYSQGTAAQISFTDMVIGGTTTQFTSVLNPVGKNFVGNVINVTSGTGFTVQRVAVVSTSGITATCDKSLGTAASTGGNGAMGACLASPGQAAALVVSGNNTFVKAGTYSISSASTNVATGCWSPTVWHRLEGYQTVRGDYGTAPLLQASGISTATLITTPTNQDCITSNITVDGASLTSIRGFALGQGRGYLLTAKNCTNNGLSFNTNRPILIKCVATGCSSQVAISGCICILCEAYSNSVSGFSTTSWGQMQFWACLSYNNSGSTSDGFIATSGGSNEALFISCVAYSNGRHGFNCSQVEATLLNCIAEGHTAAGALGFNITGGTSTFLNCAGYNNTSDNVLTAANLLNIAYVALTASPFVNAASGNFALNNNNPGGAQLRAAGIPGTFPSGTTVGYLDIGAVQHADLPIPFARIFTRF